jgi:hypothetical protein
MALQQSALAQDQAFRQQELDAYNQKFGPMEAQLLKEASSEQPMNLGPTWAKIQANFDQAGRNNEVSLARKGMLGSGIDRNNTLETGRAMALSDAFSQGLQNRNALRERLLQAGKQMPGQVGLASQGNTNMASLYGQQAGIYGQAAASGWQGVGSALGALGWALGNQQGMGYDTEPGLLSSSQAPQVGDLPVSKALGESPINTIPQAPSPASSLPSSTGGWMNYGMAPLNLGAWMK